MRILITGAAGQLGQELRAQLADEDVVSSDVGDVSSEITNLDIADRVTTIGTILDLRPDIVLHVAAYTNVDGCEVDPDLAYRVNALGTQNVALGCQRADSVMLYVSTDYVFDGVKGTPYLEFDRTNPISVYGASKLAGESYVCSLLRRFYIVRTAWLYGNGTKTFPKTILAAAERQPRLLGVTDEIGSPTWARDLAVAIGALIHHPAYGVYHLINEGHCSRAEFVRAILDFGGHADLPVDLLTASEFNARYPLPAKRPGFAALRNFCAASSLGIRLRPWREALREFVCSLP